MGNEAWLHAGELCRRDRFEQLRSSLERSEDSVADSSASHSVEPTVLSIKIRSSIAVKSPCLFRMSLEVVRFQQLYLDEERG